MFDKVLTISIAGYNIEKTIERAVKSLLIDDVMDKIEVIIEDDGSKDRTAEIGRKFVGKYPGTVVLNSAENGGYGATINRSVVLAHGKYFKQLDGDDWFVSENLKGFVEHLDKTDADIVLSPFVKHSAETGSEIIIGGNEHIRSKDVCVSDAKLTDDIGMHSLCIKTELMRSTGLSIQEHCFYTDFEYVFYSIINAKTASQYDMPIYCYLLGTNEQSVSVVGTKKHYKDRIKVVMRAAEEYEKQNGFEGNTSKELIDKKLRFITGDLYISFTLLDDQNSARLELKELDKKLKFNYPLFYNLIKDKNVIRMLRVTRFNDLIMNYVRAHTLKKYYQ